MKMNQILLAPRMETSVASAPKVNAADNVPEVELTPDQQIAALQAELTKVKSQLAKSGMTKDLEEKVIEKMRAGLSREQAIECARRQQLYDEAYANSKTIKDPAEAKTALDAGIRDALRS